MAGNTYRERVGIAFFPRSATAAVDLCVRAERANVDHAWMVMPATSLDTLTPRSRRSGSSSARRSFPPFPGTRWRSSRRRSH
jgi:hypothetical protein